MRAIIRLAALAALAALSGCAAALVPLAAASVASIVAVQRDPADILVSAITGLDCSIVRLSDGKNYCKPVAPPPAAPLYCTRSLANVDCWDRPNPFGAYQRGLADGPADLTAEQEWRRIAPWPAR